MRHLTYKALSIATLGMLAASVQAQSSLRIYGIVDAALSHGTGSNGTLNRMSSGGMVPPRFGLSGSEDLGGGLKLNFALEAAVNVHDGTGATNGALSFNRQSWVGLQSKEWGEIRLGRNFNPTFRLHIAHDPFMGGGIGGSQAALGSIGGYGNPAGLRTSGAVEYWSPSFHGLTAHAAYAKKDKLTGADANDDQYAGINLRYQDKNWTLGLGYSSYRRLAQGNVKEVVVGANYKLQPWTFYSNYTRTTTGTAGDMQGYLLGLTHRQGPYEVRTSWSTSTREDASGNDIGSARKLALAGLYHFSKRTSVYAIVAQVRNGDGSAAIPWSGLALNGPNGTARVWGLGITHTF